MHKTLTGKVISVKNNTAVVEVIRYKSHPLYKKLMLRSKKYKVQPGKLVPKIGDSVKIIETRPISKDKHFRILEESK